MRYGFATDECWGANWGGCSLFSSLVETKDSTFESDLRELILCMSSLEYPVKLAWGGWLAKVGSQMGASWV